jgi:hypothetical protein
MDADNDVLSVCDQLLSELQRNSLTLQSACDSPSRSERDHPGKKATPQQAQVEY